MNFNDMRLRITIRTFKSYVFAQTISMINSELSRIVNTYTRKKSLKYYINIINKRIDGNDGLIALFLPW